MAFDFVLNRAFLDYIDDLCNQESVKKFLGLAIFALKATNKCSCKTPPEILFMLFFNQNLSIMYRVKCIWRITPFEWLEDKQVNSAENHVFCLKDK